MSGGGGGLGTIAGLGLSALAPELAPEILGADAGAGETMLFNAALGGVGSALTGGNALLGAGLGALGGGRGIMQLLQGQTPTAISAMFPSTMGASSVPVDSEFDMTPPTSMPTPALVSTSSPYIPSDAQIQPGLTYSGTGVPPVQSTMGSMANVGAPYPGQGAITTDMGAGAAGATPAGATPAGATPAGATPAGAASPTDWSGSYDSFMNMYPNMGTPATSSGSLADQLGNWISNNPLKAAGLGLGGYTLYNLLTGKGNNYLPGYTPPTYGLRGLSSSYAPVRTMAAGGATSWGGVVPSSGVMPEDLQPKAATPSLTSMISSIDPSISPMAAQSLAAQAKTGMSAMGYADGGLASLPSAQRLIRPNVNFMGNNTGYPMGQQTTPLYAMPSQMPTSAQQVMASYEPATNPLTGEATTKMADGGTAYDPYAEIETQDMMSRLSGLPSFYPGQSMADGGDVSDNSLEALKKYLDSTVTFGPRESQPSNPYGPDAVYTPGQSQDVPISHLPAYMLNELGRSIGVNRTVDPRQGYWTPGNVDTSQPYYYDSEGHIHQGAPQGYAGGGELGGYSDGGQMLKGPGDGMSDSIPAKIGDKQPARLADGEFVIPADVVSHLGNGSTDAGAKQLYAMMDKVRKARTGNSKQGRQINPQKFMPA